MRWVHKLEGCVAVVVGLCCAAAGIKDLTPDQFTLCCASPCYCGIANFRRLVVLEEPKRCIWDLTPHQDS